MGDLKNAKMFGGIGSILMLVGFFIPSIGLIVTLVGAILVIVAVKQISEELKENDIFKNYLMYFILFIISLAALFSILLLTAGAAFSGSLTDILSSQTGGGFDPSTITENMDIPTLIGGCLLAVAVFWILQIIAAIFLRKSFNNIGEKANVGLFGTTGLVYLIGAATLIIIIGFIIIFIALIMQIIAFFSLPEKIEEKPAVTTA